MLGPGYLATPRDRTPDTMRAYLQLKTVETSDPDLQWVIDPAQPDGTLLSVTSSSETLTAWKGTVKLPKAGARVPYRILVAEFEEHTVVRCGQPRRQGHLSRRHRDLKRRSPVPRPVTGVALRDSASALGEDNEAA